MSWSGNFVEENEETETEIAVRNAKLAKEGADGPFLYLKAKGQLSQVKSSFSDRRELDGLIRAIKNFPMRGHEWFFTCSCANASNGQFAVADDRGQIYVIDTCKNSYKLVRSASIAVSAMQFLPCRDNQLIGKSINPKSSSALLAEFHSSTIVTLTIPIHHILNTKMLTFPFFLSPFLLF
jgi:hypothetical protein